MAEQLGLDAKKKCSKPYRQVLSICGKEFDDLPDRAPNRGNYSLEFLES